MLRRAQAEAARRGLERIEYVHTSVEGMPFKDATFDLCLTYNGLHCFSDPPAALVEMARVVRPRRAAARLEFFSIPSHSYIFLK